MLDAWLKDSFEMVYQGFLYAPLNMTKAGGFTSFQAPKRDV